jgi:hypothetical protein
MKVGSKPRLGLAARTAVYMLAFAFGSLLFAGGLAFGLKSVAEGALAPKGDAKSAATVTEIIGELPPVGSADKKNLRPGPKAASKARPPRANEAANPETGSDSDQPL